MKLFYHLLFASCVACITTTGCNKSSPPPAQSKREILAKTWKTGKVFRNDAPDANVNYSNYRWRFNTDSTYVFTLSGGQTQNGRWELTGNDENTLLLDKGTNRQQQATIQQLTETNFDSEKEVSSSKNGTYRLGLQLVPA